MMRLMDACEGLGSDVLYDVRNFYERCRYVSRRC